MIVGILKELHEETRVALLPEQVQALVKQHITVWVEEDAGIKAFASNELYQTAGAEIQNRISILKDADIIVCIHPPENVQKNISKPNQVLIGVFQPLFQYQLMENWAQQGYTVFSLDMIPRTTRAQSMDVLSSQANIAGYKAVLLAANLFPRYFPMFMTAAGSIPPAKVLVLGAGVAGLQAIATARRLGAVVEVFDTRPAVKEEVMSLGARFIEVEGAADASKAGGYAVEQSEEYKQKQQQKIAESVAKADIIITTAQIPGKKAPLLITEQMINTMKAGSIIIDLAASTGGNTPFTKNNEIVKVNHVSIVGNSNLSATMPWDASKVYGKNMYNFLQLLITKEGELQLNFEDDLVKGCCIAHQQNILHSKIQELVQQFKTSIA